jgi:chemotaxis protein methyltransferase CheR
MAQLMSSSATDLNNLLARMQQGAHKMGVVSARAQAPIHTPPPAPSASMNKAAWVHRLMLLVEARFGIHPSAQVERKIARVLDGAGDADVRDWVSQLEGLPPEHGEWLSLVESLTVHETYFCRDKPWLAMLSGDILSQIIEQKMASGDYSIKVWSAGCSTGEEPYDIAILVLEALQAVGQATESAGNTLQANPRWRIEILGTDVSRQVLRTAVAGVYADVGMGSFRSMSNGRLAYYQPVTNVQDALHEVVYKEVRPFVRKWVQFRQHNLLSGRPPDSGFDLVLCRNVMIYFEEDAKRLVQDLFHSALSRGGALALGGTDVQCWPERYLRRSGVGGAWYIKR